MEIKLYQDLLTINWNLLFSLLTVIVLILVLKHFFFDKVYRFMEERAKQIGDSLAEAEEKNQLADQRLAACEQEMSDAEKKKREIISSAMEEARIQADEVLRRANVQADAAKEKGMQEIQKEKENARKELQKEVGSMAVYAAGRILEQELDREKQAALIDRLLDRAEGAAWAEE